MRSSDLAREMRAASATLSDDRAAIAALDAAGIDPALWRLCELIGLGRIVRHPGGLYEPNDAGRPAYITPVLAADADGPEAPDPWAAVRFGGLIDLLAWHPDRPDRWALRTGAATWLGAIPPQYLDPPKVRVRRTPLDWLRADCTGIVILTTERAERYRLLSACRGGILADDARHAAELRAILERPWPHPPVTIAAGAHRAAA